MGVGEKIQIDRQWFLYIHCRVISLKNYPKIYINAHMYFYVDNAKNNNFSVQSALKNVK